MAVVELIGVCGGYLLIAVDDDESQCLHLKQLSTAVAADEMQSLQFVGLVVVVVVAEKPLYLVEYLAVADE